MRKDYDESPEEIKKHGLDFHWDNKKVWSLDLPVEEIEVCEIDWMLELPFWHHQDQKYSLCPKYVLDNMDAYPEHKERILKANIKHPIDVIKNQNDRLEIIDGMHRLVRLILAGNTKVKVRIIPREFISLIEE